jgi:hypothetical protein
MVKTFASKISIESQLRTKRYHARRHAREVLRNRTKLVRIVIGVRPI